MTKKKNVHIKGQIVRYVFIILGLTAAGSLVFQQTSFKKLLDAPQYNHSRENIIYYRQLVRDCRATPTIGCCLTSVNRMRAGGYRKMTEMKCPKGYIQNTLKCSGSYTWCEPKEKGKR